MKNRIYKEILQFLSWTLIFFSAFLISTPILPSFDRSRNQCLISYLITCRKIYCPFFFLLSLRTFIFIIYYLFVLCFCSISFFRQVPLILQKVGFCFCSFGLIPLIWIENWRYVYDILDQVNIWLDRVSLNCISRCLVGNIR